MSGNLNTCMQTAEMTFAEPSLIPVSCVMAAEKCEQELKHRPLQHTQVVTEPTAAAERLTKILHNARDSDMGFLDLKLQSLNHMIVSQDLCH